MSSRHVAWAVGASLAAVAVAAPARAEEPSPAYQAPENRFETAIPAYGGGPSRRAHRVTGLVQRNFETDLEGDRGTLALTRAILEAEGSIPVRCRFDLRWGVQFEGDWYDFSDEDDVVPGTGRLMEEGYAVRAGPGFDVRIGDTWGVAGGIFGAFTAVPGADLGDSLTFGGTIIGRHQFSPKFGLRLGVTVASQLEDGVLVVPTAGLDGGPTTGPVRFGARANGVRAAYAFTPRFSVGLSVRYDSRDFRFAEDDRVPEGAFRDIRVPVGVDASFDVNRCVTVGVEAGVNVYEEIKIFDKDGDVVTNFEADPSFYLALNLTWVF